MKPTQKQIEREAEWLRDNGVESNYWDVQAIAKKILRRIAAAERRGFKRYAGWVADKVAKKGKR